MEIEGENHEPQRHKRPPSGVENANIISFMTFGWISPLIWKGRKGIITEDDLQELSKNDDCRNNLNTLLREWDREVELHPDNPSLWRVLWRAYGYFYVITAPPGVVDSVNKIAQPVLLGYLIRWFADPNAIMRDGLLWALGLSVSVFIGANFRHIFFFQGMRTGMRVRLGLIALMYRKCLQLSSSAAFSTGKVINHLSNDVQPFENAAPNAHYIWLGAVELGLSFYFLWSNIGVSTFAGLAAWGLLGPIQGRFASRFGSLRTEMTKFRDDRIRSLSDILMGIELVKLYAWEEPMIERVNELRDREFSFIRKANYMRAINMSFVFFTSQIISACAFLCFWGLGNQLTADRIFTCVGLFNVARLTLAGSVARAIESISESRVSARRIRDFLVLPELKKVGSTESSMSPNSIVELKNASFTWKSEEDGALWETLRKVRGDKNEKEVKQKKEDMEIDEKFNSSPAEETQEAKEQKAVLRNLTFSVGNEELLAIVGPVGSGKTSLCMAILRELPLIQGVIDHAPPENGRTIKIAYASQSPWIFAGSIRDNILFGERYDEQRFREVIEVCELERDLTLFEKAENTLIGEKGVTLSGGQRARVGLARAIYAHDVDLYVFDDPLSAVDPHVGRNLFSNAILTHLAHKPRILVTHQLQYIKDCDKVLVLEHGEITHQGAVKDVMEDTTVNDPKIGIQTEKSSIPSRKTYVDVLREFASSDENETDTDAKSEDTVIEREQSKEKVADGVNENSLASTSGEKEGEREEYDANKNLITLEDRAVGQTPLSAYWAFFRSGSSIVMLLFLVLMLTFGQISYALGDWYLSLWSAKTLEAQRDWRSPLIYAVLVLLTSIISITRSLLFYNIMMDSSVNIFRKMLSSIVNTTIAFFYVNPHGRILNFSKDASNTDELLPTAFFDATQCAFSFLGSIAITCAVDPWVTICVPFLAIVFISLRTLYLLSSRQVKRIESTTRSPVYSLLSETLDGLTTVRAFAAQKRFLEIFLDLSNDNCRAWFSYIGSARWLGVRIDYLAAVFFTVSAFACVLSRATQSPQLVGLSLSYVLTMIGQMQWAIRQSVEVEIMFVSVERMLSYMELPTEAPRHTDLRPSKDWPKLGQVEFRNMSLTYPGGKAPVLKNVSVKIKKHEKIGIVGRTGAGKSSLLTAMFRLIESQPRGCIIIDDLPISDIGTRDLRLKLSIIPQEPFLFKGTLRFNLDPFSEYEDHQLWQALEAAELKNKIASLPGGLETPVSEHGKNFSVGERQLISLCRAILKNSSVIVMDEATANVDTLTDRLIQKSIHTHFRNSTVLTIAHRLNTVIGDYDRVMVLDAGEVVEFGEPWELLQKEEGWLTRMVHQTGTESEASLRRAAEERWNRVVLGDEDLGEKVIVRREEKANIDVIELED